MATIDEVLQSIIAQADSVRSSLSRYPTTHGEELLAAAKRADNAVEEIVLVLESPVLADIVLSEEQKHCDCGRYPHAD